MVMLRDCHRYFITHYGHGTVPLLAMAISLGISILPWDIATAAMDISLEIPLSELTKETSFCFLSPLWRFRLSSSVFLGPASQTIRLVCRKDSATMLYTVTFQIAEEYTRVSVN